MRRTLITRPLPDAHELARLMRAAGLEPICFPTIEIRPIPIEENPALQHALKNLSRYDWIVFTSANAVAPLPRPLPLGGRGVRGGGGGRIAAIGAKTAAALRARGIEPDLIPDAYTAEALVQALGDLRERWVLFPASDIARETLPKGVVAAGGVVHQITVYRTLPAEPAPEGLSALHRGVDWLTFTSPSTAQNFVTLARRAGLNPLALPGDPKTACIGPITAEAVRALGFRVDAVAHPHTTEGLVAAIQTTRPRTTD